MLLYQRDGTGGTFDYGAAGEGPSKGFLRDGGGAEGSERTVEAELYTSDGSELRRDSSTHRDNLHICICREDRRQKRDEKMVSPTEGLI